MTRIEELARKLNQEILALEVVQEYQKYEKLVLNDEKLKQLEKELKVLQKKIVNQKAKQDDRVTKTIQEYQEKKAYYENHPLVVNYLYLQNEVNEILQTINQQMNNALKYFFFLLLTYLNLGIIIFQKYRKNKEIKKWHFTLKNHRVLLMNIY